VTRRIKLPQFETLDFFSQGLHGLHGLHDWNVWLVRSAGIRQLSLFVLECHEVRAESLGASFEDPLHEMCWARALHPVIKLRPIEIPAAMALT